MAPNGKEFIKAELGASMLRMKSGSGTWQDGTVAIGPLIAHAEVQDRVLILLLDEMGAVREIVTTFVDQRRFISWMWKGVAGVIGANGLIFMVIQIKNAI